MILILSWIKQNGNNYVKKLVVTRKGGEEGKVIKKGNMGSLQEYRLYTFLVLSHGRLYSNQQKQRECS